MSILLRRGTRVSQTIRRKIKASPIVNNCRLKDTRNTMFNGLSSNLLDMFQGCISSIRRGTRKTDRRVLLIRSLNYHHRSLFQLGKARSTMAKARHQGLCMSIRKHTTKSNPVDLRMSLQRGGNNRDSSQRHLRMNYHDTMIMSIISRRRLVNPHVLGLPLC